jgi:hypothetical protein
MGKSYGHGFTVVVRGTLTLPGRHRGLSRLTRAPKDTPAVTICLSRGHDEVASAVLSDEGDFVLRAPALEPDSYYFAAFADGRAGYRRRIQVRGELETNVGRFELPLVERASGIWGLLWDARDDRPVPYGSVRLEQHGRAFGHAAVAENGLFSIAMSCQRPLPEGEYQLVVGAPGYQESRLTVAFLAEATTYSTGRIELERTGEPERSASPDRG